MPRRGVKEIHDSGVCTACDLDRYYSYRAEKGKTGRMLALFGLTLTDVELEKKTARSLAPRLSGQMPRFFAFATKSRNSRAAGPSFIVAPCSSACEMLSPLV